MLSPALLKCAPSIPRRYWCQFGLWRKQPGRHPNGTSSGQEAHWGYHGSLPLEYYEKCTDVSQRQIPIYICALAKFILDSLNCLPRGPLRSSTQFRGHGLVSILFRVPLFPLWLAARLNTIVPSPDSRNALTASVYFANLLPVAICCFVTAVLVLKPNTMHMRIAIFPVTLWCAFRAATTIDIALTFNEPGLNYLNYGICVSGRGAHPSFIMLTLVETFRWAWWQ